MIKLIHSLQEVAGAFDAFVLDQWGVLHNGLAAYPGARAAAARLVEHSGKVLVLSNSGKRASLNAVRMAGLGFGDSCYSHMLTSGEALWLDLDGGKIVRGGCAARNFYVVAGAPEDVGAWFDGLTGVRPTGELDRADMVLLIGIREGSALGDYDGLLDKLHERGLELLCANPDKVAPGPHGLHLSPGGVAQRYEDMGGSVTYYGKPHAPVFEHARHLLNVAEPSKMLVVGDTLGTDIAGGAAAGMGTLLIRGGVLAAEFANCSDSGRIREQIAGLAARDGTPLPDYSMNTLKF